MTEEFQTIVNASLALGGIALTLGAIAKMHSDFQKRKIAEAKEKSTGVTAIEAVREDIKKNTGKIDNLEQKMEEALEGIRYNSREYLGTLKDLASRIKS